MRETTENLWAPGFNFCFMYFFKLKLTSFLKYGSIPPHCTKTKKDRNREATIQCTFIINDRKQMI